MVGESGKNHTDTENKKPDPDVVVGTKRSDDDSVNCNPYNPVRVSDND